MAPTPTPQDIELPGVQGQRPIAGYDLGPAARGAQALARGVETLGQGVTKSAEDIAGAEIAKRQADVQNGLMQHSATLIQNRAKYSNSNDPNDIDRWEADNAAARDKLNAALPPPVTALGAHGYGRADHMDAEEDLRIATRRREVSSSTTKADLEDHAENIRSSVTYDPTHLQDAAREEQLRAYYDKVDSAVARRDISPLEGQHYRRSMAQKVLDAEIHATYIAAENQPHTPEGQAAAEALYAEAKAMTGRQLRDRSTPMTAGGAPRGAVSLVSQAETGDPTLGTKALGNISRDSGGTKSYGFMGLNSGSGSAAEFAGRYGAKFGLRGVPGSPGFDAQWKAAALDQPDAFRAAQLEYFNEKHVAPVPGQLQKIGIPEAVSNDPRVVNYFADRHVQMGTLGLQNAAAAWQGANGDIPTFLRNMNRGDAANLNAYFPTAIASGVYGPQGHATRLNTRLNGALAAGEDTENGPIVTSAPGQPPSYGQAGGPEHPAAGVVRKAFSPEQIDILARKIEASRHARAIDSENAYKFEEYKKRKDSDDAADGWIKKTEEFAHTPGSDFVALAGQINNDDRLEWRTRKDLLDRLKHFSGEEQSLGYGPGWRQARDNLFSDPGSPGHINSVSDLIKRDDITHAGLADLYERANIVKKDTTGREGAYTRIENSFLKDVHQRFSLENPDDPFMKIRNPKGLHIFDTQFVPEFVRRVEDLKEDARKTGDYRKVDEFLSDKGVSALADKIYPPNLRKMHTISAENEARGEKVAPAGEIPAAPEGIKADAWRAVVRKPPLNSKGQPFSYKDWADDISLLIGEPSPQADAEWNQQYGRQITAQQVRDRLGITDAAALARQAEGAGAATATPAAAPTSAPAAPPEPPAAPPPTAVPAAPPAFHGGRARGPSEEEIQASEREKAAQEAERARQREQIATGRFEHGKPGAVPVKGATAMQEQERQRKARVEEQLSRLNRDEAEARENITNKRQLERELKRIDAERESLKKAKP